MTHHTDPYSAPLPLPGMEEKLALLRSRVGKQATTTPWEHFDQAAVTRYGAMTGEDLWIHTDPERASQSRFGTTLVQASLLMARFGAWVRTAGMWLPEPATPLNYGYDRIRIPGALPVGQPVRGKVALKQLEESATAIRMHLDIAAERPDSEKPVIAAEWIILFLLPENPQP